MWARTTPLLCLAWLVLACDAPTHGSRGAPAQASREHVATKPANEQPGSWPPTARTAEVTEPATAAVPTAATEDATTTDRLIDTTGPELLDAIRASKAHATLVNVWASWCGSCKDEIPMLASIARDLAGHGVQLMLLSADEPKTRKRAQAFLEERGLPLPSRIMKGPLSEFGPSLHPRWSGAIPATFLFDADGDLAYYWAGPLRTDELLPVLQAFLSGEHVEGASTPALGRVAE